MFKTGKDLKEIARNNVDGLLKATYQVDGQLDVPVKWQGRDKNEVGVRIVIPQSIKPGFYFGRRNFAFGLFAHTLQADQRWIFLLRIGNYRFGYRTRGDAKPEHATYYNAGLHFGKKKGLSGRG